MEQALYRKYRSRTLEEVIGQEHITKTLAQALKSGRVAHAYLFTGPRGVGKTSVARILAHEVNKLPYKDDSLHMDIIEIDAASNRRIDEVRDLRERVHIAPTSAKYKVYIIDEVHMLTREAFNALLKTLEEPPAHVIFILATTEGHKLPETIVSRTQKFSFKPVDRQKTSKHLAFIAKNEKIKIDPEALMMLAQHGDGSFRDSISMLDQIAAAGDAVDGESVRQMLGLPPAEALNKLLEQLKNGRTAQTLQILEELWEQGASPAIVATELSNLLRNEVLSSGGEQWMIELLKQLIAVAASPRPFDQLEIAVLEATSAAQPEKGSPQSGVAPIAPRNSAVKPVAKGKTSAIKVSAPHASELVTISSQEFDIENWPTVVEATKKAKASLYTALRLALPRLQNDKLELAFQFSFHQRKVDSAEHRRLIEDEIEKISGARLKVICLVDKTMAQEVPEPIKMETKVASSAAIETISSIFGKAEMLES